ncbi:MAG: phosphatase PAP2 family protein [Flavobacterium sp.]|nr:phosphatase PAP2 family protein [Pedobacter sp.]
MPDLITFDQSLFTFINQDLSNPFFDWLMPLLRNRYFWSPLYLFLIIFFIRNYKKQGWMLLFFFILTFGVTDYITSSIIKPGIARLRPCNDLQIKNEMNLLISCGSGYSFPSSHAANHFALAVFLINMFYKRWRPILVIAIFWAASICFAQVYVGVHYPFDVLFGALTGSIIGFMMAEILMTTKAFRRWKPGS